MRNRRWSKFARAAGRVGWLVGFIGLLILAAGIVFLAIGAEDDAFNDMVGWSNIVGAVAAVIGLALVLLDRGMRRRVQGPPAPLLSVAGVVAGITSNIDGATHNEGVLRKQKFLGPKVDITLRNKGTATSLVTRVDVRFRIAQHLEPCFAVGGPIWSEIDYDIAVPPQIPATPFVVGREIRYELRPDQNGRFTLTIGPRTSSEGGFPFVALVEIALIHDEGNRLPLGPVALVDTGDNHLFYPTETGWVVAPVEAEARACMARNTKLVESIATTPGVVLSKEFETLREAIAEYSE